MTIAESIRRRIEFLLFRSIVCVVQALSPRFCAQLAEWMAAFVHYVLPRKLTRYQIARDNIRTAFGDRYNDHQIDEIIRRMWVHLFRLVGEMIHLPRKLRLSNVVDAVEFRGKEDVVRALCSGRPVLLLSGHFGNWELASYLFGLFGFRMGLVARILDNPYLERWFRQFRRSTGHQLIPKKGGAERMTRLLEQRGTLALLADQDAGSNGIFVEFFGRIASTHRSIAVLSLHYDALICVGYARRLEGEFLDNGLARYEVGCEAVIDPRETTSKDPVREITQLFSWALERAIRRAPEQYFWVHRRWKSVPKARVRGAKRKHAA